MGAYQHPGERINVNSKHLKGGNGPALLDLGAGIRSKEGPERANRR